MKPLKFNLAAEFDHSHREIEVTLSEISEVAMKFSDNMERLRITVLWPLAAMVYSAVDEMTGAKAAEDMKISRFDSRLTNIENSSGDPVFREWKGRKNAIMKAWNKNPGTHELMYSMGAQRMEALAKEKSGREQGFMTLASVAILGWTYLEALFEELHRVAIKNYPQAFSHLTGNERFRFQKKESIRDAYKITFLDDKRINNSLSALAIDGLSLLRNLLVHKGGIVDSKFKRDSSDLPFDAWASLPVGKPIEITGEVIESLLSPSVKASCRLIKAVDDWIIRSTTP